MNKRILYLLIFFLICLGGFFVFGGIAEAAEPSVVINEIAWMGTTVKSSYEWIEFYNPGSSPIDIASWSIYGADTGKCLNFADADGTTTTTILSGRYLLYANRSEAVNDESGLSIVDIWDATIGMNDSSPGQLILYNALNCQGDTIDIANQLTGNWFFGNKDKDKKYTMERVNGQLAGDQEISWRDSINPDGSPRPNGSPRQANSTIELPPEEPAPPEPTATSTPETATTTETTSTTTTTPTSGGGGWSGPRYYPSNIVINEILPDPEEEKEVEWIELYNNTNEGIPLDDWWIEDNTGPNYGEGKATALTGLILPSRGFLILEKGKQFSFSMNDKGDVLLLRFRDSVIDQMTYGSFADAAPEDNAPLPKESQTAARRQDGFDTNNDSADFVVTTTPTKGKPNIIPSPTETQSTQYSKDIIINEILPNPWGDDSEKEFIELKNISEQEINLAGWQISDNSTNIYTFSATTTSKIAAKGFLALWREESGIALNNTGGDSVKLIWPNGQIAKEMKYTTSAPEGQSYNFNEQAWFWSTVSTPGAENTIAAPNHPPKAVINAPTKAIVGEIVQFDGSDSYDSDKDSLNYQWNFGDNENATSTAVRPIYIFPSTGERRVSLAVSDGRGEENSAYAIISVAATGVIAREAGAVNVALAQSVPNSIHAVFINEFIPNPEGSDEQEWIELFNAGEETIDLGGWQLDDGEEGSHAFTIPQATFIGPGAFVIFSKRETRIALNNSADQARLFAPGGALIDSVSYDEVKEGWSFSRSENGQWFWTSTPTPGEENLIISSGTESKSSSKQKKTLVVSLEKVREQDDGDLIQTEGVVSVEPGVLGKQIFYLSGSGIQVYFGKKKIPALRVGDLVQLVGTLGESNGEKRLRLATEDQITVLAQKSAPTPKPVAEEGIDEGLEGSLIAVEGEVLEVKSNTFYLDNGADEIKVYIQAATNIGKPGVKIGDLVKVTGIVSQTKSGYRLLPRYLQDIEILKAAENTGKDISTIPAGKSQINFLRFFSATTVILSILVGGLLYSHRQRVKEWWRHKA